jgi:hypothetical protein
LIEKGAQPAIYINSYGFKTWVLDAVHAIYSAAESNGFKAKGWRILPFVNAMHEKYDFTWEREWRVVGSVRFTLSDLVCVILPTSGNIELREALAKAGVAAISPGWTFERIVAELARQQRKTKLILGKLTPKEKPEKTVKGAD